MVPCLEPGWSPLDLRHPGDSQQRRRTALQRHDQGGHETLRVDVDAHKMLQRPQWLAFLLIVSDAVCLVVCWKSCRVGVVSAEIAPQMPFFRLHVAAFCDISADYLHWISDYQQYTILWPHVPSRAIVNHRPQTYPKMMLVII